TPRLLPESTARISPRMAKIPSLQFFTLLSIH
ncbi:MAG: hypothetical protein ACI8RN_002926, partial [Glaciecola sp.]